MQRLDAKSRSLFCEPLNGPVHEHKSERVKIRIPKGCDTYKAIARCGSSTLRVAVCDIDNRDTVDLKDDCVTILVGMYDARRKPGETYIPGLRWKKDRYDLTEGKVEFDILIRDRPSLFDSPKRVLDMRICIGKEEIGRCLPMPLYFYPPFECAEVADVELEYFSDYEDHLRIYFEPHPKTALEGFHVFEANVQGRVRSQKAFASWRAVGLYVPQTHQNDR